MALDNDGRESMLIPVSRMSEGVTRVGLTGLAIGASNLPGDGSAKRLAGARWSR